MANFKSWWQKFGINELFVIIFTSEKILLFKKQNGLLKKDLLPNSKVEENREEIRVFGDKRLRSRIVFITKLGITLCGSDVDDKDQQQSCRRN